MKLVEREDIVKVKDYYEAFDGKRFYITNTISEEIAKSECEKYEESAEGVITKDIQNIKIADGTYLDLDPFGMIDDPTMIFKINNKDDLNKLNMYLEMQLGKSKYIHNKLHIDDSYIGKEIIITWNYDMDWAMALTFEEYMAKFKENYYAMIEKYKK